MRRSIRLRLSDIAAAISGIEETVAAIGFDAYARSWQARSAVERGLEIISEASRHISPAMKKRTPGVPWQEIASIGNVLQHEYQRVNDRIVWNIIQEHLPVLVTGMNELLAYIDKHGE